MVKASSRNGHGRGANSTALKGHENTLRHPQASHQQIDTFVYSWNIVDAHQSCYQHVTCDCHISYQYKPDAYYLPMRPTMVLFMSLVNQIEVGYPKGLFSDLLLHPLKAIWKQSKAVLYTRYIILYVEKRKKKQANNRCKRYWNLSGA